MGEDQAGIRRLSDRVDDLCFSTLQVAPEINFSQALDIDTVDLVSRVFDPFCQGMTGVFVTFVKIRRKIT